MRRKGIHSLLKWEKGCPLYKRGFVNGHEEEARSLIYLAAYPL